jgi:hypothetical protein
VSLHSGTSCVAAGNEDTPKNPTLFTLAASWNGTRWSLVKMPFP